ncbi:glycosyltransferase family 4 protein [Pontibacter pudoricolor]|uniref:glycosyltransferase family 4 protein n=1 Tax=Pontibacter pudoricolor TaxID=2694930 RepID=UPI001391A32F|nr:glycosyltransferase family 4 protein [Pontibacter pudoricolor]
MLKIAYILPSLANQGPILVVRDIVRSLHQVAAITVFYFDPVVEITFDCPTRRISMWEKVDLTGFDIVHSHMLRPDAFIWLNSKRIKGRTISTIHNYVEDDLRYRYNKVISVIFTKVWDILLRKHDLLVTLTADMEAYYRKLYKNPRICYVHNGRFVKSEQTDKQPVPENEQIEAFKDQSIVIGVAALLTHRKGIDQLLHLIHRNNRYKLLIIGDGQVRVKLEQLAKQLQVSERCMFLGYKKGADNYYRYFDVYAMPSRSEGFPLALIEAAAFGLPTICSDLPAFKEIFSERDVAFLNSIILMTWKTNWITCLKTVPLSRLI